MKRVLKTLCLMVIIFPCTLYADSYINFCNNNDYALRFVMIQGDFVNGFRYVSPDSCRSWPIYSNNISFAFTRESGGLANPKYIHVTPSGASTTQKLKQNEVCIPLDGNHFNRTMEPDEYDGKNVAKCPSEFAVGKVSFGVLNAARGNNVIKIIIPRVRGEGSDLYAPNPPENNLPEKRQELSYDVEAAKQPTYLSSKKKQNLQFLSENSRSSNVRVLENGIQYKVSESGTGVSPTMASEVGVRYIMRTTQGIEIDNHYNVKTPLQFKITSLFQGMQDILLQMKVGDKWIAYIPPEFAYGEEGRPGLIGPNEIIVVELSLESVSSL